MSVWLGRYGSRIIHTWLWCLLWHDCRRCFVSSWLSVACKVIVVCCMYLSPAQPRFLPKPQLSMFTSLASPAPADSSVAKHVDVSHQVCDSTMLVLPAAGGPSGVSIQSTSSKTAAMQQHQPRQMPTTASPQRSQTASTTATS